MLDIEEVTKLLIAYWCGADLLDLQERHACQQLADLVIQHLPANVSLVVGKNPESYALDIQNTLATLAQRHPIARQLALSLSTPKRHGRSKLHANSPAQQVSVTGEGNQVITVGENIQGGLKMGDTYNVEQAGIIATGNAHVHDVTFTQIGSQIEKSVDLIQLADELSKLRQAMKKEATETEHDIAVSEVAKAEQAAKGRDAPKVAEYLKAAGKWALDIATKIGVPLAIEALKQATGIK